MSYRGSTEPDMPFTLASGVTITGYQVVIPNTSPTNPDDFEIKVADAGTTVPLGVAQVDDNVSLTAGEVVTVRLGGITKAIAADSFAVGAHLVPTAAGLVTDTDPATGKWFVGIALTSAAQLGDEVLVLINRSMNEA